jgi:hypothetical protein
LPDTPASAQKKVAQVAVGSTGYALAWKESDNSLVGWGRDEAPASQVLASLRSALGGKPLPNVKQMSAGANHTLILQTNGALVAGYDQYMKGFALPPAGAVKGRLVRISAGDGYSLGVDTGK